MDGQGMLRCRSHVSMRLSIIHDIYFLKIREVTSKMFSFPICQAPQDQRVTKDPLVYQGTREMSELKAKGDSKDLMDHRDQRVIVAVLVETAYKV